MKKIFGFLPAKQTLACALMVGFGIILSACGEAQTSAEKPKSQTKSTAETKDLIYIGVDSNFPPMAFRDASGNWQGFDIELANEAFKRLGQEHDVVDIHWKTKERQLNEDKTIDLIWSGLNISPERRELVDFTTSYMSNKQVVVVLADSPIQTLADLAGKTVGTQEGSSLVPKLKAREGITVKDAYPEYAAEFVALAAGEIDASAMGGVAASYYMENSPNVYRILSEDLGETEMAVATRKGDSDMLQKLDKVLLEMAEDGTIASIKAKWFK